SGGACRRRVSVRSLRAPGGPADFLGPAVAALPPPRGRAGATVVRARHPRRRSHPLRIRAGHRAGARRHGDGATVVADPRAVIVAPYVLELSVGALMLIVFAVGVLARRPVGPLATVGVLVVAAASLALAPS